MSKRRRGEEDQSDAPFSKRRRDSATGGPVDRLSSLSNELLLHILSFLPISSLGIIPSIQCSERGFGDLEKTILYPMGAPSSSPLGKC
ncbi:hypothetical protein N7481_006492 [Penicillium waksmanii]|uniref:uncharacterized protein n=1 Tax=Penicillium waksmanii TaxID=69791 RepID=UPI002548430F|nr:uncharacterized protein N7481_006492 [Penicillium waksmanii]KAJ5984393.1 hypothetical protein N7481_006492 [Penicillium waksmanii]